MKPWIVLIISICFLSCNSGGGDNGNSSGNAYTAKILSWQEREQDLDPAAAENEGPTQKISMYQLQEILENLSLSYLRDKKTDHWKTSQETLRHGGGDCEDLAGTYFIELRRLGLFNDHDLIIVMLDTSQKPDHALVALATPSGDWFVVDYQEGPVVMTWDVYQAAYPSTIITAYNLFDIWDDDFPIN